MDKDFLFISHNSSNWFWKKYYYAGSNSRYFTFQTALNLLHQRKTNPFIVETGCQRLEDDLGAGMSTSIFAEYISKYGGSLLTIDISKQNLLMAGECVKQYDIDKKFLLADSILGLQTLTKSPDLLYLDSFDYPYGELLNIYGGQRDIEKAIEILNKMIDKEIIEKYSNIILPCQEHCLNEFLITEKIVDLSKTILLLDDNQLPGGGKPRLLKEYLLNTNWICLLDFQQSLWIKKL